MQGKLYDSELRIMDILWNDGPTRAMDIAIEMEKRVGWSKTTTYTVIKRCIDKEIVRREYPKFLCTAVLTQEEARKNETESLIKRMYGDDSQLLIETLIKSGIMSADDVKAALKKAK